MSPVILRSPWGRGVPVTDAVLASSMWVARFGASSQAHGTCSHCGAALTRAVALVDGVEWGLDCAATAGLIVDRRRKTRRAPPYMLTGVDLMRMRDWAHEWEVVRRAYLAGETAESVKPAMRDPRMARTLWRLAEHMSI